MNDKTNFLLIEHGGNRKQFTLEALLSKKMNVYLACSSVPDWLSEHIDTSHIIQTDTYNTVKLLSDIVAYMELTQLEFSAVGTFYEHTVTQTADVASALGLKGLDPGAARRSSSNKLLMRRVCREAGIPTPHLKVAKLSDKNQLDEAIKSVGTPCVVKPIFGAESYGTIKVDAGYDIDNLLAEITLNTSQDKKEVFKNFTGTVLIEQYLPGKVVSVDGIVQGSKPLFAGMVEFVMGPEPRFAQEANYIPARLDATKMEECKSMTTRIIKALGLDNCGFHCELRLTPEGPVLLEIAARLPGGPLQLGYKKAFGFDLTSSVVDLWLGRDVELKPTCNNYVLQKAVFPRKEGKITKMDGLHEAQQLDGIWDFAEILHTGDDVVTYPNIPVPYYYYAISAPSESALKTLSNDVEKTIAIKVS